MVEKSFSTIFTVHRSIKIKHVNKQLRLSKNIQDIKVVLTWYILALINVSSKVRQVYEKYRVYNMETKTIIIILFSPFGGKFRSFS